MINVTENTFFKLCRFLDDICDEDCFIIVKEFFPEYIDENNIASTIDLKRALTKQELKIAKEKICQYYIEADKLKYPKKYISYLRHLSSRAYLKHLNMIELEILRKILNE